MGKNDSVEEVLSDFLVSPIFRASENDSELVTKEFEALLTSEQAITLESSKEQFDTIRHERVSEILLSDTEEDLLVGSTGESLEDHDYRYHVFRFSPTESKSRSSVREVVKGVGLGCLVDSYRSDRYTILRVSCSSVTERRSNDRGNVISTRDDEESYKTFVSVDDEVSTHLFSFFVMSDEFGRRKISEVTASRLQSK